MTAVVCVLLAAAPAQPGRYDLGERLRRFEAAWDAADAAGRRRATPVLNGSVVAFFANNYPEAAKALDRGRRALAADPPPAAAWADALALRPASRYADAADTSLTLTLAPFYPPGADPPDRPALRLSLAAGDKIVSSREAAVGPLPLTLELPSAGAGDRVVRADVLAGGRVVSSRSVGVSASRDRDRRLAALPAKVADDAPALERATVGSLAKLLKELAAGASPETDYPADRLLAEAEAAAAGGAYYTAGRPGQFWLTVPAAGRDVPVRLMVPNGGAAGPRPLVVALHGAGCTENMFFDGYGAGVVVRECARRGWLALAPRDADVFRPPPVPELIDALAGRYRIDRKRVFLVGHSMGAARAVAAARAAPGPFAAVVALGGGGNARDASTLKDVPVFAGWGGDDFLKRSATLLAADLRRSGAALTAKEYAGVEHLTVVAAAAADVFAFLDRVAAPPQ